jgi:hypothetical protein
MRNLSNQEKQMIEKGAYFSGRKNEIGDELVVVAMLGGWVVAERYENKPNHPNGTHSLSTKILFHDRDQAISSAQFRAFHGFGLFQFEHAGLRWDGES